MSDEYARRFMGGEQLRFLDKVKVPRWMHAMLLGSGVLAMASMVLAGQPVLALPLGGLAFFTWSLMSTIRVSVTDAHVYVQYGLWGPKIRLADIVDVEAVPYRALKYGGWGIRIALSGERAYSVPGAGKAVQIKYRDGDKERVVVVSSERPEQLKAAIDEARGATASAALDGLRAGDVAEGAEEDEELAAARAEVEELVRK